MLPRQPSHLARAGVGVGFHYRACPSLGPLSNLVSAIDKAGAPFSRKREDRFQNGNEKTFTHLA